ncbi:MAG: IS4 family transposase [Verrucomicrobiota bacterium]
MKQKAPFLAGFSRYLFGRAKRGAQEKIRRYRQIAIERSPGGYGLLFEKILPPEFLALIDPTKRNRHFGHIPVFWAWIGQILEQNASCSRGLGLIQAWCAGENLSPPKGDTSGYCQARKRLCHDFLDQVLGRIMKSLRTGIRIGDRWHGMTLKAIDGTSVKLMDTPENQDQYPQPSGQKAGCGFPVMGMVGMVNLSHGGWEGFTTGGCNEHDARGAQRLLDLVAQDDLILADRAFCSFELIARIQKRGGECLMRLHQARHRKLDWRRGKKVSKFEREVTWDKPARQPATSELSPQQWAELPEQITLRCIKKHYRDRTGAKRTLVVVTTLLDAEEHDAGELLDLYAERWYIELKFRDVKTIMRMESLAVKSPDMAHKTLLMMMIAYNLLRSLMQNAAAEADRPIIDISFKGTLDLVTSSHSHFGSLRSHPRKRTALREQIIETCATKIVDLRPYRQEPRAVKTRPKPYQLLTSHRHIFHEIPHKETYRKPS